LEEIDQFLRYKDDQMSPSDLSESSDDEEQLDDRTERIRVIGFQQAEPYSLDPAPRKPVAAMPVAILRMTTTENGNDLGE
jgi:hypothetical protein